MAAAAHDCLAQMICFKPADRSLDALIITMGGRRTHSDAQGAPAGLCRRPAPANFPSIKESRPVQIADKIVPRSVESLSGSRIEPFSRVSRNFLRYWLAASEPLFLVDRVK